MKFLERKINNKNPTYFINCTSPSSRQYGCNTKCWKKCYKIFNANMASSYCRVPSGVGSSVDRISRKKNEIKYFRNSSRVVPLSVLCTSLGITLYCCSVQQNNNIMCYLYKKIFNLRFPFFAREETWPVSPNAK